MQPNRRHATSIIVAGLLTAAVTLLVVFLNLDRLQPAESSARGNIRLESVDSLSVELAPNSFTEPPAPAITREGGRHAAASRKLATKVPPNGDETLLRIRVLDGRGQPVHSGHLDAIAGPGPHPEAEPDTLHLSQTLEGEVTVLRLPSEMFEVVLTASTPGHRPGRTRVERIRVVDGHWHKRGLVIRDVEIRLDASFDGPLVQGRIRVDGSPGVPKGLQIVLMEQGSSLSGALPDLALIDRSTATYAVQTSRSHHAAALWVTSQETAPSWLSLEGGSPPLTVDIELESGITLVAEVVDADDGTLLSGHCLRTHRLVPSTSDGHVEEWRPQFATHIADEHGYCTVRGLPTRGHLSVLDCNAEGPSNAAGPLLTLRLGPDLPRILRRKIRIQRPAVGRADLWGDAPSFLAAFTTPMSTVNVVSSSSRSEARVPVGDGRWNLQVEAGIPQSLWLEIDGRRITDELQLRAEAGERRGPLTFAPRISASVELRWQGIAAGARLTVAIDESEGSARILDVRRAPSSGSHRLLLFGPSRLDVAVTTSGGATIARSVDCDPARDDTVAVDFGANAMGGVRLELTIDGGLPLGTTQVLFHALNGPSSGATVIAPLTGGRSSAPAPLARGTWYFRARSEDREGLVCGMTSIGTDTETLRLNVQRVELNADLRSPDARGVEVTHSAGVALEGRVPSRLLRLSFPDSSRESSVRETARILVPEPCTLRTWR